MKTRRLSAFCMILLIVVLSACSTVDSQAQDAEKSSVALTTVQKVALDTNYDLSGTLLAYDESPISFEIGGTVNAVNGNVGDTVKKGSILATLDPADLKLKVSNAAESVQQAQAGVASAQAELKNAQGGLSKAQAAKQSAAASVAAANARVESARVAERGVTDGARTQQKNQAYNAVNKAQTTYNQNKAEADRAATLYQNGLLTKQEYEQAQTALQVAQESLNDAKQQLSLLIEGASASDRASAAAAVQEAQVGVQSAETGIQQANAGLEQAQAGIAQAQAGVQKAQASYQQAVVAQKEANLSLSRTTLKSSVSGIILEKNVSNGQTVAAGTSVFTVGEVTRLKVLLPIADQQLSNWKVGQKVSVSLYDQVRTGTVKKIYPATNKNTGSINAEVIIANPQQDWKPGQVVKASEQATGRTGIAVPASAVISTSNDPYVFINQKGKAVKTPVQIGELYNNQYEIKSGLKVGDQIVSSGADRLIDGDVLQVQKEQHND